METRVVKYRLEISIMLKKNVYKARRKTMSKTPINYFDVQYNFLK